MLHLLSFWLIWRSIVVSDQLTSNQSPWQSLFHLFVVPAQPTVSMASYHQPKVVSYLFNSIHNWASKLSMVLQPICAVYDHNQEDNMYTDTRKENYWVVKLRGKKKKSNVSTSDLTCSDPFWSTENLAAILGQIVTHKWVNDGSIKWQPTGHKWTSFGKFRRFNSQTPGSTISLHSSTALSPTKICSNFSQSSILNSFSC